MSTLTTRVTALESDLVEVKQGISAILAHLEKDAPAKAPAKRTTRKAKAQPKAAKQDEFVTWLRDTAEARTARKASNAEMAAWLRSKGLVPNGAVWEAAKKGERSVAALKKLA